MSYDKSTVHKVTFLLILVTLIGLLVPTGGAQADVGPKPSMDFEFVYETEEPLGIVEGQQMQCEEPDCADAEPLEEVGPNSFRCSGGRCSSRSYGYSTYNQLVIEFSDGVTRTSDVFSSGMMRTEYRVTVHENSLEVERVTEGGPRLPFLWVLLARLVGTWGAIVLGIIVLAGVTWRVLEAWGGEDEP
jgi:hypothetical protein